MLITHDHYDHLEVKTIKFLRNRDTRFIVPLGVGARLRGWGVPEEAVTVCEDVRAGLLLPVHWGVFDLALHPWDESIEAVWNLASERGIGMVTPLMGEKIVPGETESRKWWKTED